MPSPQHNTKNIIQKMMIKDMFYEIIYKYWLKEGQKIITTISLINKELYNKISNYRSKLFTVIDGIIIDKKEYDDIHYILNDIAECTIDKNRPCWWGPENDVEKMRKNLVTLSAPIDYGVSLLIDMIIIMCKYTFDNDSLKNILQIIYNINTLKKLLIELLVNYDAYFNKYEFLTKLIVFLLKRIKQVGNKKERNDMWHELLSENYNFANCDNMLHYLFHTFIKGDLLFLDNVYMKFTEIDKMNNIKEIYINILENNISISEKEKNKFNTNDCYILFFKDGTFSFFEFESDVLDYNTMLQNINEIVDEYKEYFNHNIDFDLFG